MPAMTSNPLTQTSAQGRGVTRHSARTLNVSFSQALVSVADRVETVEFGLPDCCERYELEVSLRPEVATGHPMQIAVIRSRRYALGLRVRWVA